MNGSSGGREGECERKEGRKQRKGNASGRETQGKERQHTLSPHAQADRESTVASATERDACMHGRNSDNSSTGGQTHRERSEERH